MRPYGYRCEASTSGALLKCLYRHLHNVFTAIYTHSSPCLYSHLHSCRHVDGCKDVKMERHLYSHLHAFMSLQPSTLTHHECLYSHPHSCTTNVFTAIYAHASRMSLHSCIHSCIHSRRRSDLKYLEFQIGKFSCPNLCVTGILVYYCEILGNPVKTWLKGTETR